MIQDEFDISNIDNFYCLMFDNDSNGSHVNNTITINIEKERKKGLYNLYFSKNNKIIGNNTNEYDIINGKILLDFNKYYCYYALSSARCGCNHHSNSGFEFQVSM